MSFFTFKFINVMNKLTIMIKKEKKKISLTLLSKTKIKDSHFLNIKGFEY